MNASVIVPTRNRRAMLADLLRALDDQDAPAGAFEIIVVDAGSADGTTALLDGWLSRRPVRHVDSGPAAAARARNVGARAAAGDLLIFLDDDMLPEPGLVSAHLEASAQAPGAVIVGPCPMSDVRRPFRRMMAGWFDGEYRDMMARGAPTALQVFSGNLVVPQAVFEQVGGFDESFTTYGGEDFEFGLRITKAGIPTRYAASAVAVHRFDTTYRRWLQRTRASAPNTVRMLERFPDAVRQMPAWQSAPERVLRRRGARLAWQAPWVGRALAPVLLAAAELLDAADAERPWLRVHQVLFDYHHWAGIKDVVGDLSGWRRLRAAGGFH